MAGGWVARHANASETAASPDQPFFRFVPGAYKNKLCFEPSQDSCEVCRRPAIWRYNGNIYAVNVPKTVCARCIANGSLTRFFGSESFGFHDNDVDASPAYLEEINYRTPGIPTWNPIQWPVIDGMPLAYVAAGETADFPSGPMVEEAVAAAWRKLEWDGSGPVRYVLLFRQIDGEQYRAIVDFN